ncbi:Histone-lysine N-methyltransferase SUV39H2 [Orchesella cincta]|uniref:Histone-lysine N-methyltransferase SUV39H2 n=1 Tax=Orchesella cincta TaxID=48709 RepID=A0A1D2NLW6_ORCCI|nr:Histone-lysine N-methyltransferase SUV39H2 [Orchesella cincta]
MPTEITNVTQEVGNIFDFRMLNGVEEYYVEWKTDSKPAWVKEKIIINKCREKLAKFWVSVLLSSKTSPSVKAKVEGKLRDWSKAKIATLSQDSGIYEVVNGDFTTVASKKRPLQCSTDVSSEYNGLGVKHPKLISKFENLQSHLIPKSDIVNHILTERKSEPFRPYEFGEIINVEKDSISDKNRYYVSWHYESYETAETLGLKEDILHECIISRSHTSPEQSDEIRKSLQRKRSGKLHVVEPAVLILAEGRLSDSGSDLSTASTKPPIWELEPEKGDDISCVSSELTCHQVNNGDSELSKDDFGCQTDFHLDPFTCQYCQSKLGKVERLTSLRQRKKSEPQLTDPVVGSKSKKKDDIKNEKGVAENGNGEEIDEDDDLVEIEYEIEDILDYRKNVEKNNEEYYIKWKGFTAAYNSWEPESNLSNCDKALIDFYVKRVSQRKNWQTMYKLDLEDSGTNKKIPTIPAQPPLPEIIMEALNKITPVTDEEIEVAYQISKSTSKAKNSRWAQQKLRKCMLGLVGLSPYVVVHAEMPELRHQLLMSESERRKEVVLMDLKVWERSLNTIGQGRPEIVVENKYDLCGPPVDFKYINDNVLGSGVTFPDDPQEGCVCEDSCIKENTCCPTKHGYRLAYTSAKRLRVLPGYPIYECNKRCACGPDCANRVVQDGTLSLSGTKLCIFRTSNKRGWGVKTLKKIKKGTFVCLYAGEIITNEEAESRGQIYENQLGACYLFDLDYYTYSGEAGEEEEACPFTIDATKMGNVAHFINHSCDPNLSVFNVWADCVDQNLPKLAFFAMRDINRDEELTYDYGTHDAKPTSQPPAVEPVLSEAVMNGEDSEGSVDPDFTIITASSPAKNRMKPATISAVRRPCLCGAKTCRKVLF